MKELLVGETSNEVTLPKETPTIVGFYLALSIPPPILYVWQSFKYENIPDLNLQTVAKEMNKTPHVTVKYFGDVTESKMEKIKDVVNQNLYLLDGATIKIDGTSIIGKKKKYKAFVGLIKCSEGIVKFKSALDDKFPNKNELPFLPHLTIQEIPTKFLLKRAQLLMSLHGHFESDIAEVGKIYFGSKNLSRIN